MSFSSWSPSGSRWYLTFTLEKYIPQVSAQGPQQAMVPTVKQFRKKAQLIFLWLFPQNFIFFVTYVWTQ
jgi:hypothetical protein